jgi:DNA-binding XRE family transcriptional regulator
MRLSGEELKKQCLRVEVVRQDCKITQEEAARLLGIAKNTWVRWESGKFQADGLKLELLPHLARYKCPQLCRPFREKAFSGARMAEHILTCRDCWLAIHYLAVVGKKPPREKQVPLKRLA